jgi:hypothetical protein
VDDVLRRFLAHVRPRARGAHLATYEDLAATLARFLEHRRRSPARLRFRELRAFLGYWYLRHHEPATPRHARRFCAAARVLVRWLAAERSPRRRRQMLREARRIASATTRAARASALLERLPPARPGAAAELVEDYCEVVARGRTRLVLRPLSAPAPIGPVAVPEELAAALDPGAIVNLQLARVEGEWNILGYGFCYPPSARDALREASAARAPL